MLATAGFSLGALDQLLQSLRLVSKLHDDIASPSWLSTEIDLLNFWSGEPERVPQLIIGGMLSSPSTYPIPPELAH